MTRLKPRIVALEKAVDDRAPADTAVEFFVDGEFLYAERNGQTYDEPLEEVAAVLTRVFFVTPPARPDDEG